MNLCSKSWHEATYNNEHKELSNIVIEFMLEESVVQLVEDYTRSENVNNVIQKSCIDHIYTNIPQKCNKPSVEALGNSDHMLIEVLKYTKELRTKPNTIKKRSYKNFCEQDFLADVDNEDFIA